MGQALKPDWSFPRITSAENMAAQVMIFSPATDAEALKLLRASFADFPLSARVAALNLLIRRSRHVGSRAYPR